MRPSLLIVKLPEMGGSHVFPRRDRYAFAQAQGTEGMSLSATAPHETSAVRSEAMLTKPG
jgi:hypothetical protein